MTKTKTGSAKRILALTLALLTIIAIAFSFTSCGGTQESFRSRSLVYLENGASEPEKLSDYVASLVATDESSKMRIIAAANGYVIAPKEGETVLQDNTRPASNEERINEAKTVIAALLKSTKFERTEDKEAVIAFSDALTLNDLEAVAQSKSLKTNYSLDREVGFPGVILVGIGWFLGKITTLFGGYYVLALIAFALLVEIVMLPVAIKQQKNMIGLAKLRPAMAKIEKKYAGRRDPLTMQKKREEMMALQQKEGYSPFAGCLPMLLQLIVVGFILYPIIQNPAYYMLGKSEDFSSALIYYATSPKATGGLGMQISSKGNIIEILSMLNSDNIGGIVNFTPIANGAEILKSFNDPAVPDFTAFGINLGAVPKIASILVLVPILNIGAQWATMFLSKKWNQNGMNPMTQDAQNAASMKIMEILPLALTCFILFQIPAMIGVYWFIRSLISLGKQYLIKIAMPIPKYTAEQIKEMEKMEKEREKAQKAALKAQPKVRSLHYIDDDDYDDLVEIKGQNSSAKHVSGDAPEIKD
ncbi:MAG: membrane protein insertase YidC [Clostridia bacterium]|nr:membrane protein insertase YidC [Clostridia bacterium]